MALVLVMIHVSVRNLDDWWLIPEQLLAGQDYVRAVSASLVHANTPHLLGNLLGLLLFGLAVDLRTGRFEFLALLLLCAIAGMVVHSYFTAYPTIPVVGASAMIYGLVGAELALMPMRKFVFTSLGMAVEIPNFVAIILFVGTYAMFESYNMPYVAWLSHLGGFAAGAALGLVLRLIPEPELFREFETWREQRLERVKRNTR